MRGRADQGYGLKAGFLGDTRDRGEECSRHGEQNVQSPAARREQYLRKERTLVCLDMGQRQESEGGGANRGVMPRGLYFYTEGNGKGWKR